MEERATQLKEKFEGVLLMLVVALLFGASAVLVKLLNQVFAYPMSVAVRALVATVLLAVYIWKKDRMKNVGSLFVNFKTSNLTEKLSLLWWVIMLGIGQMCFAYAVLNGINFSNPAMFYLNAAKVIISFFLGMWLLSEHKSYTQIIIIISAILGLIVFPLDDKSWINTWLSLPTFLALTAGAIEGISTVSIAHLPGNKYDRSSLSLLKYATAVILVSFLTIILKWSTLSSNTLPIKDLFLNPHPANYVLFGNFEPTSWLLIGTITLLIMGFTQSLISVIELKAYQFLDKAMANVILQSELIFSSILVLIVFGTPVLFWQKIGLFLLLAPSIAAGLNQWWKGKKKHHR